MSRALLLLVVLTSTAHAFCTIECADSIQRDAGRRHGCFFLNGGASRGCIDALAHVTKTTHRPAWVGVFGASTAGYRLCVERDTRPVRNGRIACCWFRPSHNVGARRRRHMLYRIDGCTVVYP